MGTQDVGRYTVPVDFRLPQFPSSSLPPELLGEFQTLFNSIQQVIDALNTQCGVGFRDPNQWDDIASQAQSSTLLAGNLNRLYVKASEAINYGAAINIWNNGGTLEVRNALSTSSATAADGYCSAQNGIASGAVGEVQLGHGLVTINNLTIGQRYWLSPTAGIVQNGPDTAAGHIEQYVGIAITTKTLFWNSSFWIQH